MSEDAPQYGTTQQDKRRMWRTRIEAEALRHVANLSAENRADAAAKLDGATYEMVALVQHARKTWETKPDASLADIALCLDDAGMEMARAELEAAGVLGIATCEDRLDPAKAEDAFHEVLADHEATNEQRRLDRAGKIIEQAKDAPDHARRADLLAQAMDELQRREREAELPLADVWNRHRNALVADCLAPHEAVTLDDGARGSWASWFNRSLGPRGGLTPGRTMIIGGGPGGGKTSLAAALATDALAAGCPVTFWQLELSVEETLEHLVAQNPVGPRGVAHHATPFDKRARQALPDEWHGLLTVPRCARPEAEAAIEAMRAMASSAKRLRRAGTMQHHCNGLLIVDYVQLLTLEDSKTYRAGHEVITSAVSRLAKAAAECGAVLVLLSQVTKESRKDKPTSDGTEFSGGDIERVAHSACTIIKGYWDGTEVKRVSEGNPCEFINDKANGLHGEPRLINFVKRRGVLAYANATHPKSQMALWYSHRALYGREEDFDAEQQDAAARADSKQPKQGHFPNNR